MTRIYYPQALSLYQTVTLTPDASNHITRVLRMRIADTIILFNGGGMEFTASIQTIDRKAVTAKVITQHQVDRESPLNIHLVQGLCRGEKMDWLIQKSVELGVASITPLHTEFGNVKLPAERMVKKLEHWQKVVIGACEQCGRNVIPTVHSPIHLKDFLNQNEISGLKLMCDPRGVTTLKHIVPQSVKDITVVVGPEGGLSDNEISNLQRQDFQSVKLGPRILRTETAPLAILSALQTLRGDVSL